MLYTHENCQRKATVRVVDTMEELCRVASVNTETGEVVQYPFPLSIDLNDEIVRVTRRFRSIHPIGRDRAGRPCLFHCYGEMTDKPIRLEHTIHIDSRTDRDQMLAAVGKAMSHGTPHHP